MTRAVSWKNLICILTNDVSKVADVLYAIAKRWFNSFFSQWTEILLLSGKDEDPLLLPFHRFPITSLLRLGRKKNPNRFLYLSQRVSSISWKLVLCRGVFYFPFFLAATWRCVNAVARIIGIGCAMAFFYSTLSQLDTSIKVVFRNKRIILKNIFSCFSCRWCCLFMAFQC